MCLTTVELIPPHNPRSVDTATITVRGTRRAASQRKENRTFLEGLLSKGLGRTRSLVFAMTASDKNREAALEHDFKKRINRSPAPVRIETILPHTHSCWKQQSRSDSNLQDGSPRRAVNGCQRPRDCSAFTCTPLSFDAATIFMALVIF